jgi:uncharacterized protein YjiS (DUF1127 family)
MEANMPLTHVQTILPRTRPGIFARLVTAVTVATLRRRDRQRLGQLDAHLLRDIGLDPLSARNECAKPFWRS